MSGKVLLHVRGDLLFQLIARRKAGAQRDERLHDLTAQIVGLADHAGLGDRGMRHQRGFDFERADALARGVDDVVGAALEPEVAVLVDVRGVAGEVVAGELEVLLVARGVVPDLAHHPGPAGLDAQQPERVGRERVALLVEDRRLDARDGAAHRAGTDVHARVVRDQLVPGLGHPPVVVDAPPIHAPAPAHHLGVERLAHRQHVAQRREVVLLGHLLPRRHQHAKRGRRRVPHGDAVALDGLVPRVGVEAAAADDVGDTVEPGREDAVRGAGHPSRIGGAPVGVGGLQVEDPLAGLVVTDHRVLDVERPLGLPRRARGVVEDERILAPEPRRLELLARLLHLLVPRAMAPALVGVAAHQHHVLEARQVLHGHALEQRGRGEERDRAGVQHAVAHRVGHEGFEQRARDRAHLEDAEDADVALGRAGQEHEHAVAARHAEPRERVGEAVGEPHQVLEGVLLHPLAIGVEQRQLVLARAPAVPVDGLVRHVDASGPEPVELGLDLLPVERGIGLVVVVEVAGLVGFGRQDFLRHGGLQRGEWKRRECAAKAIGWSAAASTKQCTRPRGQAVPGRWVSGGASEARGSQGWRSEPRGSEPEQDAEANVPPETHRPRRRLPALPPSTP